MMRFLVPATLMAAGLTVGSAAAQSNTLSIQQGDPSRPGTGNTITVDQSQAGGSTVGGLTLTQPTSRSFLQVEEPRGDEDAVQAVTVNTLSAVAQPGSPARQRGDNNTASVTITGWDGFVGLLQESGTGGTGNAATVNLAGAGEALVGQIGNGNVANLTVTPAALGGTILQDGTGNNATLGVTGAGATGLVSQVGSGLTSNLTVDGAGTSVSLYQDGVGQAFVGGPGTSVISNGATVTITQTAIGGAQ